MNRTSAELLIDYMKVLVAVWSMGKVVRRTQLVLKDTSTVSGIPTDTYERPDGTGGVLQMSFDPRAPFDGPLNVELVLHLVIPNNWVLLTFNCDVRAGSFVVFLENASGNVTLPMWAQRFAREIKLSRSGLRASRHGWSWKLSEDRFERLRRAAIVAFAAGKHLALAH